MIDINDVISTEVIPGGNSPSMVFIIDEVFRRLTMSDICPPNVSFTIILNGKMLRKVGILKSQSLVIDNRNLTNFLRAASQPLYVTFAEYLRVLRIVSQLAPQ